jgi:hypothetical protein
VKPGVLCWEPSELHSICSEEERVEPGLILEVQLLEDDEVTP